MSLTDDMDIGQISLNLFGAVVEIQFRYSFCGMHWTNFLFMSRLAVYLNNNQIDLNYFQKLKKRSENVRINENGVAVPFRSGTVIVYYIEAGMWKGCICKQLPLPHLSLPALPLPKNIHRKFASKIRPVRW